jgi:hypothetical protein
MRSLARPVWWPAWIVLGVLLGTVTWKILSPRHDFEALELFISKQPIEGAIRCGKIMSEECALGTAGELHSALAWIQPVGDLNQRDLVLVSKRHAVQNLYTSRDMLIISSIPRFVISGKDVGSTMVKGRPAKVRRAEGTNGVFVEWTYCDTPYRVVLEPGNISRRAQPQELEDFLRRIRYAVPTGLEC